MLVAGFDGPDRRFETWPSAKLDVPTPPNCCWSSFHRARPPFVGFLHVLRRIIGFLLARFARLIDLELIDEINR